MAETPMRFIRISDETWDAAARRAESEGSNISAEIRSFLESYVSEGAPDIELARMAKRLKVISKQLAG